MKSWTRTLNLDDAHTLLAVAEPGTRVDDWSDICHGLLPELSVARRRELIRILRDGFLDIGTDGRIVSGLFLEQYRDAPAVAQIDLVQIQCERQADSVQAAIGAVDLTVVGAARVRAVRAPSVQHFTHCVPRCHRYCRCLAGEYKADPVSVGNHSETHGETLSLLVREGRWAARLRSCARSVAGTGPGRRRRPCRCCVPAACQRLSRKCGCLRQRAGPRAPCRR